MANAIRALTMDAVEQAKSGHPGMPMGTAPRIAVEAAVQFGWERWLGPQGAFIGMTGLEPRRPARRAPDFAITPEKVAEAARSLL
jgi:transketolase